MTSYKIITEPTAEPVDKDLFKQFKGISITKDDDLIEDFLLPSARKTCEQYTNRRFINTTIEQYEDKFQYSQNAPNPTYDAIGVLSERTTGTAFIRLSGGEIQSITSLKVTDINNTETTISASDYFLDGSGMRLVLKSSTYSMPSLRDIKSIAVRYVVGYGATADSVPMDIKQAIILTAQAAYDFNRSTDNANSAFAGVPELAKTILNSYRISPLRLNAN
jgi:hypothetical protein